MAMKEIRGFTNMLSWCNKWADIEIKIFILKKSGYNTKHDVLSWEPLAQWTVENEHKEKLS